MKTKNLGHNPELRIKMDEFCILIFTSPSLLTRHRHVQLAQLFTSVVGFPKRQEVLAADPPQPQGVVTFISVTFKSLCTQVSEEGGNASV